MALSNVLQKLYRNSGYGPELKPNIIPFTNDLASKANNIAASTEWVKDLAATHIYLDPAGDDANDGFSASSAVKTITRALEIAQELPQPVSVFEMAAGSYNGDLVLGHGRSLLLNLSGDVTIVGRVSVYDCSYIGVLEQDGVPHSITVNASNTECAFYIMRNSAFRCINSSLNIICNNISSYALTVTSSSMVYVNNVSISGTSAGGGVQCNATSFLLVYSGLSIANILTGGNSIHVEMTSRCRIVCNDNTIHSSSSGDTIRCTGGSQLEIEGKVTLQNHAVDNSILIADDASCFIRNVYIVSTKCANFIVATRNSLVKTVNGTLSFSGTVTGVSIASNGNSCVDIPAAVTFSGTVTGKRYDASYGGIINVHSAGANKIPGSTAGTVDSRYSYYG